MLARLALALASLLAASAMATVTIEPLGTPLPKQPEWPDVPAELAAALALELPATPGGELELRPAESVAELRQSFLDVAGDLPRFAGDRGRIPALVIGRGVVDIRQLADQAAAAGHLACAQSSCTLGAPLHVGQAATLVIRDVILRMDARRGALIASSGLLLVADSSLVAVGSRPSADGQAANAFRPFLVAFGGSATVILRSTLRDLGFAAAHAYGLTLTSQGPAGLEGPEGPTGHQAKVGGELAPPSATIAGNRIEGLYRGLYTHGASEVAFLGNLVHASIDYGVDPHDGSQRLLIGANRITGSGRHGLITSRRVRSSWVIDNLIEANAGSGIVLDRQSSGIVVGANRVVDNGGDGIAIYESPGNLVVGNRARRNRRAGLRVRNSVDTLAIDNDLRANGDHGLTAYSAALENQQRRADDVYARRTSLVLIGNHLSFNRPADLKLEAVEELRVLGRLSSAGAPPVIAGDPDWQEALGHVQDGWRILRQ